MKILAIEASGMVASVAVLEDGVLVGEYTINHKKTHSQTLLPMLDELCRMAEMDPRSADYIAVSAGPGSFTGLRIGSATAKGLVLSLGKPLVGVPTLEALAFNLMGADGLVCPIMDARRNQVYTGVYDVSGKRPAAVLSQRAMGMDELVEYLNFAGREVVFLGDGVPVFEEYIKENLKTGFSFATAANSRQRAASVAALAQIMAEAGEIVEPAKHRPEYLRKSQAEREREERLTAAGDTAHD